MDSSPSVDVGTLRKAPLGEKEIRLISESRSLVDADEVVVVVESLHTAEQTSLGTSRRIGSGRRKGVASERDNAIELLRGQSSLNNQSAEKREDVGRVQVEVTVSRAQISF